jgi:hypothetical protein
VQQTPSLLTVDRYQRGQNKKEKEKERKIKEQRMDEDKPMKLQV